jgi:4-carboxymuconolactone decarboxylase
MTPDTAPDAIVALDGATAALVRLSARVAAGREADVRAACTECVEAKVPVPWVEEALLQSYLFCGFPRTLNAMREWRRIAPAAPAGTPGGDLVAWRTAGERTCAVVYGPFYEKLRHNIAALHPDLDEWMIVEGYGKILSRPGLPLRVRELCIVAACVAAEQERQLHSHLHGALHAGAPATEVRGALAALEGVVAPDALHRAFLLFDRVAGKSGHA